MGTHQCQHGAQSTQSCTRNSQWFSTLRSLIFFFGGGPFANLIKAITGNSLQKNTHVHIHRKYWVGQNVHSDFPNRCYWKIQMNFLTNPIFFKSCLVIFWNSCNQDVSHFQKPVLSPASFYNFLNQTRIKSRQLAMLYSLLKFSKAIDFLMDTMWYVCICVCVFVCMWHRCEEGGKERERGMSVKFLNWTESMKLPITEIGKVCGRGIVLWV